MVKYILNRILWLIPVILAASFIVFFILDIAPGSVLDLIVTDGMTEEDIAELATRYHLDKPLLVRYLMYMWDFVRGDLGESIILKQPVADLFFSRFPATVKLAFGATGIALVISLPLGILAATKAGTIVDTLCSSLALIGTSIPGFWMALMFIIVFSVKLHWFPSGGDFEGLRSLVLPAMSNSLVIVSALARQTRSSMLEVLSADYLTTARSKGVKERTVVMKHALQNALIPIITTLGDNLAYILAGSVVTETVFVWPGIGRMLVEAVLNRDTPLATGSIILITIIVSVVLLITDLLYAAADPRIKAIYKRGGKLR